MEYKMNEGRHAGYYFQFSRRDTGEILLEGCVSGGNKQDCRNSAHNKARSAGLKPFEDDNIKLYMRPATEEERNSASGGKQKTIKGIMAQYGLNMKKLSARFGIPYRTVQNWNAGVNTCPTYIINMIAEILEKENKQTK